jgi:hypothetical protein
LFQEIGGEIMITKIAVFGVLSFLLLPVTSFAQNGGFGNSEKLNIADIPNGSIVVLSKEAADTSGYVHERYAFVDRSCLGGIQFVDHYGPPVDPRDPSIISSERAQCEDSRYRNLEEGGD